jgi:hypothetical protein
MFIRRLSPDEDRELIVEALNWVRREPRWSRDADSTWGEISDEGYLEMMKKDAQVDIGIFEDDELRAMLTVAMVKKGVFNTHLLVKRGTKPETIAEGALAVKLLLIRDMGAKEIWAWLASVNRGAQRVVKAIGMSRNGISILKGHSHGRVLEWQQWVCYD